MPGTAKHVRRACLVHFLTAQCPQPFTYDKRLDSNEAGAISKLYSVDHGTKSEGTLRFLFKGILKVPFYVLVFLLMLAHR